MVDSGESGESGSPSYFEQLGGEVALRKIIDRFVDRIVDDVMIGFFFRDVDRDRLKQLEYEFAASHLGAGAQYTGRPLDTAHRKHPIMGGQFNRRLKILEKILDEFDVPVAVRDHWLAHNERLRPFITRDAGGLCDPTAARDRALAAGGMGADTEAEALGEGRVRSDAPPSGDVHPRRGPR